MSDWIYLEHEETGGTTRVPDDPDVIRVHEAKGWSVVDPPDTSAPFVPPKDGGQVAAETEWVELVHPESGGVQRVPNNPDALAGAYEAGWQVAAEPEPLPVEPAEPEPELALAPDETTIAAGEPGTDKEG
jgi:hypothetical protein